MIFPICIEFCCGMISDKLGTDMRWYKNAQKSFLGQKLNYSMIILNLMDVNQA